MIADCELCERNNVPCSGCEESQRTICFLCQGDIVDPYCELDQPATLNVTTLPAAPRSSNPFEAARLQLIKALLAMKAPAAYPAFPTPSDHEGIAAHIRDAAAIFDEWLAAIGAEVRDNAVTSISAGLFAGSFIGAVDGNETYACEMQAVSLRDERQAMRRAS